jgi:hypothetical protein
MTHPELFWAFLVLSKRKKLDILPIKKIQEAAEQILRNIGPELQTVHTRKLTKVR